MAPTRYILMLHGSPVSGKEHTTWGDCYQELADYDAGKRPVIGDPHAQWGPHSWAFTGGYVIVVTGRLEHVAH